MVIFWKSTFYACFWNCCCSHSSLGELVVYFIWIILEMELIQKYDSLFPDYQFLKLVGQGSYGDVYRCIRKSDKIQVAVKIVFVLSCDEV